MCMGDTAGVKHLDSYQVLNWPLSCAGTRPRDSRRIAWNRYGRAIRIVKNAVNMRVSSKQTEPGIMRLMELKLKKQRAAAGKKGGKNAAAKMTPEQRRARALAAVEAREKRRQVDRE